MASLVPRGEPEARVDLAADRISYLALSYGLLLSVVYRSYVRGEAAWDLLALVVLGGIVGLAYRVYKGTLSRRATVMLAMTAGIAIVVSALLVIAGR